MGGVDDGFGNDVDEGVLGEAGVGTRATKDLGALQEFAHEQQIKGLLLRLDGARHGCPVGPAKLMPEP